MTRITITGDGPWQVRFTDDLTGATIGHTITAIHDDRRIYPDVLDQWRVAVDDMTAAQVTATLRSMRTGGARPEAVKALGRYLFAALCAPVWKRLESWFAAAAGGLCELSFDLDAAPALLGLPWEVMARADRWLAQGVKLGDALVDVAITRRTARRKDGSSLALLR